MKLTHALTNYFGLNRTTSSHTYWSTLPACGGSKSLGCLDLNYSAECTSDFVQWAPVPDQGSGAQRSFTVPVTPGEKCFIRLRVSQAAP